MDLQTSTPQAFYGRRVALVRCTCIAQLTADRGLSVLVPDPMCGYVVHRVAGPSAGSEGHDAPI